MNYEKSYKQLYYINRGKIKADGTTAIMCRATIDGKAVVLATQRKQTTDGKVINHKKNSVQIGL